MIRQISLPVVFLSLLVTTVVAAQTTITSGTDITYTLPRAVKVSQEDPGFHTVHWDGNDQMGRPQPPGTYSWKLLHHTGLKADYVLSVGNSGQPPYRTEDDKGSWGGCHGNPLSIHADASGLYITWYLEEGNAVFAHTDYDGRNIYKIHSAWTGRNYDSAVSGKTLYRLECGATGSFIQKYDIATGKYTPWDAKSEQINGGKLRIEKEARPIPDRKAPKNPTALPWDYFDPVALAVNTNFVVASFPNLNKIAIFRSTGEQLDDVQIDQPHGGNAQVDTVIVPGSKPQ